MVYLEPTGSLAACTLAAVRLLTSSVIAVATAVFELMAVVQELSKAAKVRRAMVMKRSAFHLLCSHLGEGAWEREKEKEQGDGRKREGGWEGG